MLCLLPAWHAQSQSICAPGEVAIDVVIRTDAWGYESGWSVADASTGVVYNSLAVGTLASSVTDSQRVCVPIGTCIQVRITDDYGDGIYPPQGYRVYFDDTLRASGDAFGYSAEHYLGCPPGTACDEALVVTEGTWTAPAPNTWYAFTPDSAGTYAISTCGLSACDTRLWVYEDCIGIDLSAGEEGTLYYNALDPDCPPQARIANAILLPGVTYYIRVGDVAGDCGGGPIGWELQYNGPIRGCTDSTSCNYDPLATVSDTCIYPGSPDCPDGPDLVLLQPELVASMSLGTRTVSIGDCLVAEECVTGYGVRDIITFSTYIYNQGNTDYYIGNPSDNPDQFDNLNCHGHTHYKGYAEYLLYDDVGVETPVGFKNGFCVMDIWCPAGTATYGCGTMGVSAGCADIYGAGTTCNWIDITDVDTGRYTFVARTNWDKDPDALGRHELDYMNNWAQVCLRIDEDAAGNRFYTVDTACAPYVDCAGEIYGSAQPDCSGDCNGSALYGDLDGNELTQLADVEAYVSGIVGDDLLPTSCNDLNTDGRITVADAALLNSCLLFGGTGHPHPGGSAHDHCQLPLSLINIYDTAVFSIGAINFDEGYLDIYVRSAGTDLVGYELTLQGLDILSVSSLADGLGFEHRLDYALGGQRIVGLSRVDSTLPRGLTPTPLCRVHWFALTAPEVCIVSVEEAVNDQYERTLTGLEGACRAVESTQVPTVFNPLNVQLSPQPASSVLQGQFPNPEGGMYELEVFATNGRRIGHQRVLGNRFTLSTQDWPAGMYTYRLVGERLYAGSFAVQHGLGY